MLIKLRANIPEIILGALLAVAIFAVGMVFESSRSPFGSNNSQQSANERSGPITPEHAADKITDWLLVGLNLFLVASTFLLWKANNRSAKIAERALTELEAPFLTIKINTSGLVIKGNAISFGLLKWCVVNYGRTPASILEIFDDTRTVKIRSGFPPAVDPRKVRGQLMPYGVIAPPSGQTEDFPFLPIPGELMDFRKAPPIPPSETVPFFIGFVRYSDIFKNRFVLGFCFVFERDGSRWVLAGGDEYNYCREESGGFKLPGLGGSTV
jgi:hypothetical protein